MKKVCVLALLVFVTALSGCSETVQRKYKEGDYVKHELDGRAGVVISDACGTREKPMYKVRFLATETTTDTHILGPDGAVKTSPYSDVVCRQFELKPTEQPKLVPVTPVSEKK